MYFDWFCIHDGDTLFTKANLLLYFDWFCIQNMNPIQYEVVKGLVKPHFNLFAVGDDDQSIYGFRGSDPSIMLHFLDDFPNGTIIPFGKNYRSVKEIVDYAGAVIKENKNRYKKEITAANEGRGVFIKGYLSKEEEYGDILEQLKKAHEENCLQEYACLFRTNMDASYLAERLLKENIPYVMREKPYNPYDHFISRDLLHYLHLKSGDLQASELIPVMNRPLRYMSRESVDLLKGTVDFTALKKFYAGKEYMQKNIQKLEYDLLRMKDMDLFASVNYIRKGIGYDEYLRKQAAEQNIPWEEYKNTADELQKRFAMFSSLEELEIHIEEYREKITESGKQNKKSDKPGVTIMTCHASKGLEFEKVYIPDCNEGNIPYRKSVKVSEIEEERRLFYVALTRAKKQLHLSYINGKEDERHLISRFLKKRI